MPYPRVLRLGGSLVAREDVVCKEDADDDAQNGVTVEVGLGVRALEAELLEHVLVPVEPEEGHLLDALERLLELDDVPRAREAGGHLSVDDVDIRLPEGLARVDLVCVSRFSEAINAQRMRRLVGTRLDAKTSV